MSLMRQLAAPEATHLARRPSLEEAAVTLENGLPEGVAPHGAPHHSARKQQGKQDQGGKEKPSREHFMVQFKKTRPCRFFPRCAKGDACAFAHGVQELRHSPNFTKSKMCAGWRDGRCKLPSDGCRFAHGPHELRASPPGKGSGGHAAASLSDTASEASSSVGVAPPGLAYLVGHDADLCGRSDHLVPNPGELDSFRLHSLQDLLDLEPIKIELPLQDQWKHGGDLFTTQHPTKFASDMFQAPDRQELFELQAKLRFAF